MRAIRLIAVSDDFNKEPGLKIKGTPDFEGFMADRSGDTIAHDLLEHQNGVANMGPVWDELEALGAIWQVRGRHGDMITGSGYHSPQVNCASDASRMFREWLLTDDRYCGPGNGRVGIRPHLYDEDFCEILDLARQDVLKNYESEYDETYEGDYLETYMTFALHRMRAGFRKAERRFGSQFCGHSTYRAIVDAVALTAKNIEYEGQEFILRYGNCDATLREVYAPE